MIKDIEKLRKQMLRGLQETAALRQELKTEQAARVADRRAFLLSVIHELDRLEEELKKALELIEIPKDQETIQQHYDQCKAPLLSILQKYNIKPLAAPFNQLPDFSVVEKTIQNTDLADGAIVAVLREGYVMGDQLFRPTGLCKVKNS
ncbi:MAG: nucleotide exchange factor GrpE [Bacteroidota bacterium]